MASGAGACTCTGSPEVAPGSPPRRGRRLCPGLARDSPAQGAGGGVHGFTFARSSAREVWPPGRPRRETRHGDQKWGVETVQAPAARFPKSIAPGWGGGGAREGTAAPPVSGSQQPVSPSRTPGATSPEGEEGQESEVCAPGRGGPTAGRSCDLRPPAGAVAGCEHRASGEGACSADAPAAPARAWSPLTTFPCKSAGVRLRQSV